MHSHLSLFQAQIRKISDRFSPDVIVAACVGAILRRATIHGDLCTLSHAFTVLVGKRSAGEHISVRGIQIRASRSTFNLLCNYTIQQRDVSTQRGKDCGEDYGDILVAIINSAIRADVRVVKVKGSASFHSELATCGSEIGR